MSDLVSVAIIGAIPPTLIGILNFVMSFITRRKLHEVAKGVDGGLNAVKSVADKLSTEIVRLQEKGTSTPYGVPSASSPVTLSAGVPTVLKKEEP